MAPPLLAVSHIPPGTPGTPAAAVLSREGGAPAVHSGSSSWAFLPTVDCLGLFHLSDITERNDLTSRPSDRTDQEMDRLDQKRNCGRDVK